MFWERDNFEQFSENVKYGNFPKIGKKGNNWTVLYVNYV